jgi:dipeptidase D
VNTVEAVLACFEGVSAIPRGTGNEAGIRTWLQSWAGGKGLTHASDAAGNLVIRVPASSGRQHQPTLVLQGHLDMVCQKTDDSGHDFLRDPIRLVRDGDWLRADKTTLGADNGIAIALMMALVEDASIMRPALELLLTVSEEQGVVGADNLDPALITGTTLLNLDSEQEGVFTVGCAGGVSVNVKLPVNRELPDADSAAFQLRVEGLLGGHSAEDIHKGRANANVLLARVLDAIQRVADLRLSALAGGTARNAIPRKAGASFICPRKQAPSCRAAVSAITEDLISEYRRFEPGLSVALIDNPGLPASVTGPEETKAAIRLILALPNGVAAMSAEIPGFVETSNNIGVIELSEEGATVSLVSSNRSSVFSRIEELTRRVESVAALAGAKSERTRMFPPWKPNPVSPLLEKCLAAYRSSTGAEARVELAHGGLECGIISDRCGGLDAVSMGPTMEGLHSPDERLFLPSLARTWDFLVVLLASL